MSLVGVITDACENVSRRPCQCYIGVSLACKSRVRNDVEFFRYRFSVGDCRCFCCHRGFVFLIVTLLMSLWFEFISKGQANLSLYRVDRRLANTPTSPLTGAVRFDSFADYAVLVVPKITSV